MSKRQPRYPEHQAERLPRREFLTRTAFYLGVTAAATYSAFAPEQAPLSLGDDSELRSTPEHPTFALPDLRVDKPMIAGDVGLGRGGTVDQRMRMALNAVGGLTHLCSLVMSGW